MPRKTGEEAQASKRHEVVNFNDDDWKALEELGIHESSLGSLLPPFPATSSRLGRRRSREDLDEEFASVAAFVFGAPAYQSYRLDSREVSGRENPLSGGFNELVMKTLRLFNHVEDQTGAPSAAFKNACKNLGIQSSTSPDQALLHLVKFGRDGHSGATEGPEYTVVLKEARKGRMRESIDTLLKVLHDLQEIAGLPPNLTADKIKACLQSFENGKILVEGGLRKKPNAQAPIFPDSDVYEPIRESLYFYSVAGIKNEVKLLLLEAQVQDHGRSSSDGLLSPVLDMTSVVREREPVLTGDGLREERSELTRLVCHILYQVRLDIQSTETSHREHHEVIVKAQKLLSNLFEVFASHADKADKKGKKKHSAASLRHTPIARQLLGYGPLSSI